jgi:hypothetical protein
VLASFYYYTDDVQEFCFFFKKKLWMEMLKFYIIAETKESK